MHCLVTGSSGLLGRCLVARLATQGHTVRLLDLVPPDASVGHGEHEFIRTDTTDSDRVRGAMRGVETVFHLAAAQRMKPQFASWTEQEVFERNLAGLRNVLDAAASLGTRSIVFTSSSGVYGIPLTLPCTEDHPTEPLGAYGRSKLLAERLCREAAARGQHVTMLRPMSLFGPGMSGVFAMLFEWVRTGRPVYVLGRGRNRVQMVSAEDVADACIRASERPETSGQAFNLGSDPAGVPTVLETVRALVEHAGTGSSIWRIPAWTVRAGARLLGLIGQSPIVPEHHILGDRNFILDIHAARVALEWTPVHSNAQLVADAYDAYVSAGPRVWQAAHPIVRLLQAFTPRQRRRPGA